MRIDRLEERKEGNRKRVSAQVVYEDSDRPTQELYFETDDEFADGLTCNPHAFLLASIVPALRHGERRVSLEGELCPDLRDGLTVAMGWLMHWFYAADRPPVQIEAKTQRVIPALWRKERAGQFFSGGIDSLATLRANRLNYPPEHPGSIKDGLLVYGLEVGKEEDQYDVFAQVYGSLRDTAARAGLTLIPAYTNVYRLQRDLDPDWHFWAYQFQGTALAAVAHAFTRRLDTVSIASSLDIEHQMPYGTHPLLDPSYSSRDMRIRHENVTMSRFDKVALIAEWDVALQNMRVCNRTYDYRPETFNCGQCEKCVRTMLELLALGKLGETNAFPVHDVSPELLLSRAGINDHHLEMDYTVLLEPLARIGRHDLVQALQHKRAMKYGRRAKLGRFGRTYLGGRLSRIKQLALQMLGLAILILGDWS